jgi:adenosylcobinamide-phosphate synthase
LGYPLTPQDAAPLRPELGVGDEADAELMASTTGLVWRAVALWLFVILLITVANWLG